LGVPIIQLPEDMVRIQEVVFSVKPDVIVETGVAHGGSLVFYASLLAVMGGGRVVGVDVEIREHNRKAIEAHILSDGISLIEGDSISAETISQVNQHINPGDTVLVILDSNHSSEHVLEELRLYSPMVSDLSYIVACDGVMKQVSGAPRTSPDWTWNNPLTAIDTFLRENPEFSSFEPEWPFNESKLSERVTYWPKAFLRKQVLGDTLR